MKKTFLAILFPLLFVKPFAYSYDGGQSTNGGNGCWISFPGGETKWRSIEELLYGKILLSEKNFTNKVMLPSWTPRKLEGHNFFDQYLSKEMFFRLEKLRFTAPAVFDVLTEMTRLFENAHVVPYSISGVYGADLGSYLPRCSRYSPALVTKNDGTVIFFQKTWNKLEARSAQLILIHETLRLAQLFHPAFKELSNHTLQKLSALLFSEERLGFYLRNELKTIEKKLRRQDFDIPPLAFPAVPLNGFINTEAAFRSVFYEALREGDSFADAVNDLKANNEDFKRAVMQSFAKRPY